MCMHFLYMYFMHGIADPVEFLSTIWCVNVSVHALPSLSQHLFYHRSAGVRAIITLLVRSDHPVALVSVFLGQCLS